MPNAIEVEGGRIVIQSCTESWANVGVFYRGQSVYYHVALPSLVREEQHAYSVDLPAAEFDRILADNKQRLIDTVASLNGMPSTSRTKTSRKT